MFAEAHRGIDTKEGVRVVPLESEHSVSAGWEGARSGPGRVGDGRGSNVSDDFARANGCYWLRLEVLRSERGGHEQGGSPSVTADS